MTQLTIQPRYLYLCRHGQSQWNAQGLLQGQSENNLTELGVQQATKLAIKATEWSIRHLYHSPLSRAQQTAQICGQTLHLTPQALLGTQERHFGNWQGKPIAELPKYQTFRQQCYEDLFAKPNAQGESTFVLQSRIQSAIDGLLTAQSQHQNSDNIMLISHGDAINCLLSLWVEPLHLENCQGVRLIQAGNQFVWDKAID